MTLRWQFGIVAGIFLAIFCLYPQLNLLYLRGDAWNGQFAYNDVDEEAYASYVHALVDARPRKNDPYSGADDSAEKPQPESLFSIQFAAPYTIALAARIFGIGVPWAMIISGAVAGFLTALVAFWLLATFTGNSWYAMAGSIIIFTGGAAFAGEGALLEIFFDGFSYPYFPGFRRYIPAMAMPAIFGLFACVWWLLSLESDATERISEIDIVTPAANETSKATFGIDRRAVLICSGILAFAYCVYSYFFIWTTAAAWLAAVGLVWLLFRPGGWRRDVKSLAITGAGCVAALVPYAILLSRRSSTMDDVQLLVLTRLPDFSRVPEFISVGCLVVIAMLVSSGRIGLREKRTLFTIATALVPLIVFNQQIVTGRSLQPIHYQVFIGNYVAGLTLVLTGSLTLRQRLLSASMRVKAAAAALAIAAVLWGFVECFYTVRVLDDANVERDEALPVAQRLDQLAAADPQRFRQTVLSFDSIMADSLPTTAPQNVLWARHQNVFAGLSWEQTKERYYQYLYYSGMSGPDVADLLRTDFVSRIALFGWGRNSTRLSSNSTPLTRGEIADEVERYIQYKQAFGAAQASNPVLSYVVVNDTNPIDLANLARWYRLDAPERIGNYTLYKAVFREP